MTKAITAAAVLGAAMSLIAQPPAAVAGRTDALSGELTFRIQGMHSQSGVL